MHKTVYVIKSIILYKLKKNNKRKMCPVNFDNVIIFHFENNPKNPFRSKCQFSLIPIKKFSNLLFTVKFIHVKFRVKQ